MKKIAVDIDNFEKLINEENIYVDKTKFLTKLIDKGTYYFLSRPRRFGKSLFLDTIRCFYQGKKELFKGLYIYNKDWEWKKYPVITIDFSRLEHSTTENLKIEIAELLADYADKYNVELNSTLVSSRFYELIEKVAQKEERKVVLLIDEYDRPIISNLSVNGRDESYLKIAKENQHFLKIFYDNLKALSKYLELVFMTGISKFRKLSVFSTLNNLIELDMHPEFSHMLGYTEKELRDNFDNHFTVFAKEKGIKKEEVYEEFQKNV